MNDQCDCPWKTKTTCPQSTDWTRGKETVTLSTTTTGGQYHSCVSVVNMSVLKVRPVLWSDTELRPGTVLLPLSLVLSVVQPAVSPEQTSVRGTDMLLQTLCVLFLHLHVSRLLEPLDQLHGPFHVAPDGVHGLLLYGCYLLHLGAQSCVFGLQGPEPLHHHGWVLLHRHMQPWRLMMSWTDVSVWINDDWSSSITSAAHPFSAVVLMKSSLRRFSMYSRSAWDFWNWTDNVLEVSIKKKTCAPSNFP